MKLSIALLAFLWAPAVAVAQTASPLTIENESLRLEFNQAVGRFLLASKPTGRVFATGSMRPDPRGMTAHVAAVRHKAFGDGSQIEVAYPGGDHDIVALFPGLPFAIFSSSLCPSGTGAVEIQRLPTVSAAVDLGCPTDRMRAFGTGGLLPPAKNPGSYAYLALVDPISRSGVVGGWITHDRGSGVVLSPVVEGTARIEARIDYGRLRIEAGRAAVGETFALGWFDDARRGLEAYADAVSRQYEIRLPPQPAGYCTWYAEKHGGACDEEHLARLAAFAAERLKPFGFEFVQIDDQWQAGVSKNGPTRNFTTHRPDGPYPNGMKAAADGISSVGLTPGIWFMPFAGTAYDPLFEHHRDWFAKDAAGEPFETRWGGFCLDMTQPGPREHLRQVVERLRHEWGFRLFKMDGLWTGTATRLMYVNDGYQDDQIGEARLADPDKTHIEAFRDGLKLVRETAGPDVFLLGCCVSQNMRSFGGSFGLVDAMRVGPDTGAGEIGAVHGSRHYFLHGRVWLNDPDCVSVRAQTPLDRARLNATWTAVSGQLFYNSDWLPELPEERLEIVRRTIPAHGLLPRPVDLFDSDPARMWLLTDTRQAVRRDVVAMYNWDSVRPAPIAESLGRVGLPAEQYVGFDFWADRFIAPLKGQISATLPPASCKVWAVRPVADHPQLVSTSRHVTQGMIDVRDERWDATGHRLSGTSRVVAADPYELRIVVPTGPRSWRATAVRASSDDAAAGVKAEYRQEGPKLRVKIASPAGRDVQWTVDFEPAAIEAPAPAEVAGLSATAGFSSLTLSWQDNGAERYRVARSDGATCDVTEPRFEDRTAERGRDYRYEVQALGWSGAASAPAAVEASMPAEPKRPPAPHEPTVHLSALEPTAVRNGWGQLGVDKSIEGNPLRVEGKVYGRGLGTHADSLLIYAIPPDVNRFVAVVGLDDEKRDDPRASVVFEVYGDVKEMGERPVLLGRSPVLSSETVRGWAFDVALDKRFKQVQLVVTDAGDGIACDHADWVDAGFR